jgi:hypothetical protein
MNSDFSEIQHDGDPCLKCGSHLRKIKHQTFANGTRHLRMECGKCLAFVRYLPQDERFSDRMFSVISDLAACDTPAKLTDLIMRAQALMREADGGKS